MCKSENVTPRKGDILFIRTGMMLEWEAFTTEQKKAYAAEEEAEHAGVEASVELLEWLWNSGIAAVAGDAISWEVSRAPPWHFLVSARTIGLFQLPIQVYPTPGEVSVHEYLLGGWGMPIGMSQYPYTSVLCHVKSHADLIELLTSTSTKGKCSTSKLCPESAQS